MSLDRENEILRTLDSLVEVEVGFVVVGLDAMTFSGNYSITFRDN